MSHTSDRINKIAKIFEATRYLEIGVNKGYTFLNVNMQHKTAVDPCFLFDHLSHKNESVVFFEMTSDDYFSKLPELLNDKPYKNVEFPFCFDIILIDGLHTFEQSYRDFVNSLPFSHKDTIWIFDDTVPCDPYSAYPHHEKSLKYRADAGLFGRPWHGDVYKTIFAIHDFHPEFSYCTQFDTGNPQTIVWRGVHQEREKVFSSIEEIQKLSYFDFLDNSHLFFLLPDALAIELIGLSLNAQDHKNSNNLVRIVKKLVTVKDKNNDSIFLDQKTMIDSFQKEKNTVEEQRSKFKARIDQLELEKAELKEHILRYKQSLSWRVTKWLRYF